MDETAALSRSHGNAGRPLDEALRSLEARHRQVLDSATDHAIVSLDLDGRVTDWNEGARRMLGWTKAEMSGQTLHRLFTPQDQAGGRIEEEMRGALERGHATQEGPRIRRDGSSLWASGQMTPLRDDAGRPVGFVKILRDRSEQRADELRRAFLFDLGLQLDDAADVADVAGAVAERLGRLLGASRVGFGRIDPADRLVIEHDWTDGSAPAARGAYVLQGASASLLATLQRGEVAVVDDAATDARTAPYAEEFRRGRVGSLLVAPLIEQGRLTGLLYINADAPRRWAEGDVALVTRIGERLRIAAERSRARKLLRDSEERLRVAQQAGGIGTFELFPATGAIAVSEHFAQMWGLGERRLLHIDELIALVHPDDRPLIGTGLREIDDRALDYLEYRIVRPDTGELRWMARRGQPVRDAGQDEVRYLGVTYDITERKRAEEQLRASRESLQLANDAADVGSWDLDVPADRLVWSERTRAMFGIFSKTECTMQDFYAGLHPDDRADTLAAFASATDPLRRTTYDVEYRTVGQEDGIVRWVAARGRGIFDEAGRCVRAIGTAIDISARKARQARQAFLLAFADELRPLSTPIAIMAAATRALGVHLGTQHVGYAQITPDGIDLVLEADYRADTATAPASRPLDVIGEAGRVQLARGRTLVHTDAGGTRDIRGFVAVPMSRGGRLHAVLYAHQAAPRTWTRDEVALVEDVAARTWDAVERARAEEQLREESRVLETLNRIGAALAGKLELDALVQRVVDAGVEVTGAGFGAFFYNVTDAEGESYMLYALAGADRKAFEGFPMPRSTDVFAPTFRGDGVVRSADITKDPRYGRNAPHHGMPAGHLPVCSYLAVPVASRAGPVIGGLFFGHPEPDVFDARSERIMLGLAAQAAIALDNARLFAAAQQANSLLEARVEERTRERDRLWELSEDLLVIAGHDGRMERVSPSWMRLLGHDEATLLGHPFSALIHPDDLPSVNEALHRMRESGRAARFEDRVRAADGSWRRIEWTLSPEPGAERMVGTGRDVTAERLRQAELAEAQEALRQAQKMEAVGQLTGGIAHDFNNLLQGITGSLDIVRRRVAQGRTTELDRFITGAMSSAQRAAALTHRLLAFSRRQPLDPRPVQGNPLVASMEDLLRRTLGERIVLELVLASGLWLTRCDPNQLESAILNLCINARDAMPDGGTLTVATGNATVDAAQAPRSRDLAAGQYVCISVTDTGTGMSPETMAKAFDPFFTTKPLGQGTGLGLSMIYGFARQSEGVAKIESELGKGTTVRLYLPRYRGAIDGDEAALPPVDEHRAHEAQCVLVIEDEAVVRGLVVELLQELGYRTIEAADGEQGLAVLQGSARIDLLVSDLGLPGLDGRQVAEAARQVRPGLKVLFMTGYAENASLADGFLQPGMAMITKPFAMDALAARVKELVQEH